MMHVKGSRARPLLLFVLKVVLAAVVLYLLLSYISPDDILAVVRSASVGPLLLAVCLIPAALVFRVVRWRVILRAAGEEYGWSGTMSTVLIGYAFSTITPAESGDYVARTRLNPHIDASRVVALTLVDKLVHLAIVFLVGSPAVVSLLMGSSGSAVLAIIAAGVLLFIAGMWRRKITGFPPLRRLAERWKFLPGLQALHDMSARTLLSVAAMSGGILLIYVVQEYLLLNAVAEASIVQTWQGFWAGMAVRAMAPVFIGDLGIREATHVYFFGLVGIPAAAALSASLLMFILNVMIPALIGVLLFVVSRRRPS